jgi:flagellar protein FliO/FliZ
MKSLNLRIKTTFSCLALALCCAAGFSPAAAAGFPQAESPAAATTEATARPADAIPPQAALDDPISGSQAGVMGSGLRAAGAMIFIVGLLLASVVLLKRCMPHRFGPLGHKRRIQLLETVSIGEKRSLALVQIDGTHLLLASTPGSVSLIKELPPCEEPVPAAQRPQPAVKTAASEEAFTRTLDSKIRAAVGASRPQLARLLRLRQELEAR